MKKIILLFPLALALPLSAMQRSVRALTPPLSRLHRPADDLREFISQPTSEETIQREVNATILEIFMALRADPKTSGVSAQKLISNACDYATKQLTADKPAWKLTVRAALANEISPLIKLPLDTSSQEYLLKKLNTTLTAALSSAPTITQAGLDDLEQFMVK